jgi:hypothetical protein
MNRHLPQHIRGEAGKKLKTTGWNDVSKPTSPWKKQLT